MGSGRLHCLLPRWIAGDLARMVGKASKMLESCVAMGHRRYCVALGASWTNAFINQAEDRLSWPDLPIFMNLIITLIQSTPSCLMTTSSTTSNCILDEQCFHLLTKARCSSTSTYLRCMFALAQIHVHCLPLPEHTCLPHAPGEQMWVASECVRMLSCTTI